jgi:hypothetical protein
MAIYGGWAGAIKATLGEITQVAANGSDISMDPAAGLGFGSRAGATYIVCVITTSGNALIEIGEASTASSFALTSSDTLICTVASDRVIGVWGDGGTPTITIQRAIV